MHRYLRSTIATLIAVTALAVAPSGALAQGVTGAAVTGVVKDPSGGPYEGAKVELKNTATGATFTAVTGADGKFFIDNVPPGGPYTLIGYPEGFDPVTRDKIQLGLGQLVSVDLEAKFAGQMIEIEAFADQLDDRRRTGPSVTVKAPLIAKLPLVSRNFTDLVATSPNVIGTSVAGQNNRFNNIQIDGGANNDLFGLAGSGTPGGQASAKPISVEAIQEFQIQVAPFDVRYGNFAGGLLNAITKSGTNEFHGSLFGYHQSKYFLGSRRLPGAGARDDAQFPGLNIWQFGGTLGGPIVKDKVHFFASVDLQQRATAFGSRPSITGNDALDASRVGFTLAEATRFIDILKNRYGVQNPGTAFAPELQNPDRNVFVKVSTSVLQNSNLEVTYNFVNALQDELSRAPTSPTIPARLRDGYQLSNAGFDQTNTTNTIRAKLQTNFEGGKMSNEFLTSLSFIRDARVLDQKLPLVLVRAGRLGTADAWLASGSERFSQTNKLDQDIVQLQDNFTMSLGRAHRLTVGTSNEFISFNNAFLQASTGVWAFNSLDDFEAGRAAAFQRRFGVSDKQQPGVAKFQVAQFGAYVQDQWQILDNLSLTPGFRVDLPFLSRANRNDVLLNTALPVDTSKVPSGNPLWSPRLGVNWDVDGTSNTVVRGGVGLFSGRPPYVWVSNAYAINGLSQVELTCQRTTAGGGVPAFTMDPSAQPSDCAGGSGTPTPPTNQGEIDYFDPRTRYPQNLRFALGADRRLPLGIVATADLLYTRDVNGWYITDENLVAQGNNGEGRQLYGSFSASTPTSFRVTPTRVETSRLTQAVKVRNKNGGEVYSGTLQFSKTFGQQYSVSVGYTYARAMDRISFTSSQAFSNFQFAPIDGTIQDRNVRPNAFDRPHKVTVSGAAALPYGFGLGLIYIGQSGTPYTWVVNGDVNGDGVSGNDVPFIPRDASQISLRDPTGARTPSQVFDALNSFIEGRDCLRAARGTLLKRGACRNPWQNFLNARLSWTSPEIRGQRFEAQLDLFNVLNFLNQNWGLFRERSAFETHGSRFLGTAGYDTANNRPVYSFVAPPNDLIPVPSLSRWRRQLGARYMF